MYEEKKSYWLRKLKILTVLIFLISCIIGIGTFGAMFVLEHTALQTKLLVYSCIVGFVSYFAMQHLTEMINEEEGYQ